MRAVEQIKRELSALEQATEQLAKEFRDLYQQYLTELGQAAKRQLVLASYHLCTQAYPDRFLQLSVPQRQRLQQALQALGKKVGAELLRQLERLEEPSMPSGERIITLQDLPPQLLSEIAAAVKGEPLESSDSSELEVAVETLDGSEISGAEITDDYESLAEVGSPESDQGLEETEAADLEAAETDSDSATEESQAAKDSLAEMAKLLNQAVTSDASATDTLTPVELVKRHMRLEHSIRGVLRVLSQDANQLLKQAKILPDLPESVLAAAAEAEALTEVASNTPNVLNVLVELSDDEYDAEDDDAEDDGEAETDSAEAEAPDPAAMTHLVAVNLRLSEVEFTDSTVAVWRTKIREQLARLKGLAQQYQQKQRERAIAEAEAAWRASWFES